MSPLSLIVAAVVACLLIGGGGLLGADPEGRNTDLAAGLFIVGVLVLVALAAWCVVDFYQWVKPWLICLI